MISKKKSNINEIIEEIVKKGSIYDDIMDKFLHMAHKHHLKPELISEICLSFLQNPEKIERVYHQGGLRWYFIRTVQNQVNSSTSPFYKATHLIDNIPVENVPSVLDTQIDEKMEIEAMYEQIEEALDELKVPWFDSEIFKLYYIEGKSYRQIEREHDIDHCLAWNSVKKTKRLIKRWIEGNP